MSISGKFATGRIGSNVISGTHKYEFRETADDLDGTSGEDNGFTNPDAGCQGGTVTLDVYFDKSVGAYVPIRAGTYATDITLYDDISGDPWVTIPLGVIMESSKTAETRGRIEMRCTIKTKGEYVVTDIIV